MQKKKLKKLLHARKECKSSPNNATNSKQEEYDYQIDDKLKLNFVTINQIKSDGMTASFNKIRRQNTKEVLNKYNHPDSQHIRLKPYYDSGTWLHWIGVLSDLTLPNAINNLTGEVLLDKLTTGDNQELLDYHVWLNLVNVKYIQGGNQKIGIGDIVQGFSKIKRYSGNKYGLDTTVIVKAGIYKGVDKPDILVSNYDRQDDWVLEIDNSTAGQRAWDKYEETQDKEDLVNEPGHVEARFQPSRYEKYRDRLQETKRETSEEVLPLISPKETEYHAEVDKIYIAKGTKPGQPKNMPKLRLKNIIDPHGRLIMPVVDLPYIEEARKMGEVVPGDIILFHSSQNPQMPNGFGLMTQFRIGTRPAKHSFIPLPESNPNTFLGYIMWLHPTEDNIPELVLNYQTWALTHGIHVDKIKKQLEEEKPTHDLTEQELAEKLGISAGRVYNVFRQGVIKPLEVNNAVRTYDPDVWNIFVDLLSAQDSESAQRVKEKYDLYTSADISHLVNMPEEQVIDKIRTSSYQPLNGWHYKVNLYGVNVYQMFKTSQTAKSLLPPRQNIRITKEIPRDVSYVDKFEETAKKEEKKEQVLQKAQQVEAKETIKISDKTSEAEELETKPKELNSENVTEKTLEVQTPKADSKIKFVSKAERRPAIEIPKNKVTTVTPSRKIPINKKAKLHAEDEKPETILTKTKIEETNSEDNITIQLTTFDGVYYSDEFASFKEARDYISTTASNKWENHFLTAKNIETGKEEMLSTKVIMAVKVKD
ncbi:helix-turn-helix domain-containing protein [Lactobacillus sp. LL6]|uniref:helix-turn-helix domain-containing protein n=1 Tax=Lactobacillus sp. LL6 TaxID=2596827 RepID=UPI00118595AD|nr:helix-turn-helix domain-containing protein [Lactobacillus sp. LL6]TSO25339.1 hypothetical protein FOD82_08875 [Lactobacillus sp. LL6]